MAKKELELSLRIKHISPLKNASKNSEVSKVRMPRIISKKTSRVVGMSKTFMGKIKLKLGTLIRCCKTCEAA